MNEHADSTWDVYKRLASYAKPYKGRIFIGVLAGLISCGSLYGFFQSSERLFKLFEDPKVEVSSVAGDSDVQSDIELTSLEVWVKDKLDIDVKTSEDKMTKPFVTLVIIGFPLLFMLYALMQYLHKYYMRWIGCRVVRDLRDQLFDCLQSQSLKFYGKTDIGQLISKCTNDTTVIETVISATVSAVTLAPVQILVSGLFALVSAMEHEMLGMIFVMAVVFPLFILPIIVLGRFVRRHMQNALARISDLVSRMHENFTGIRVVKAFDMETRESVRFHEMNHSYFRSVVAALKAELLMTPVMECIGVVLVCVFIVSCYIKGISLSQIMPIGLAAFFAYKPAKQLANINANLQRGYAALERVYDLLDTDTALEVSDNPCKVENFEDKIVFDDVVFSYDAGGANIVDHVSFEIPKGSVVALVGETGSGKSTMANLLARFYDPTEGRVLMDGRDLKDIDVSSLRKMVGVVTQDTILFNDTIANNIAYGSEGASREAIVEAAQKANAHEFITASPEGYERMAGEKGFVLSGGEKQRVAVARAILKNPPILILDEATSALDTVTERLVQEAIARVMENRTVFAIAHRLSTIKNADQILLIDNGRIAEQGTHDALYEAGGRYRKLCDMQVLDA